MNALLLRNMSKNCAQADSAQRLRGRVDLKDDLVNITSCLFAEQLPEQTIWRN